MDSSKQFNKKFGLKKGFVFLICAIFASEAWGALEDESGEGDSGSTEIENPVAAYTISYYVDGEAYGDEQSVEFNSSIPEITISEKRGYVFGGWSWYSLEGDVPVLLEETPVAMPAYNLRAEGNFAPVLCTVTFDAGSGTFGETSLKKLDMYFDAAISADEISDPEREGFAFVGWSRSELALAQDDALGTVDDVDGVIFYAVWQRKSYMITFDTKGGSSVEASLLEYGSFLYAPESPVKIGYKFDGWFLDESFKEAAKFPMQVQAKPLTIYARWKKMDITVTAHLESVVLDCVGADACNDSWNGIVHYYGKASNVLPKAIAVNSSGELDVSWIFQGWFEGEDGSGKKIESIAADDEKSYELFPYFTKNLDFYVGEKSVNVEIDFNDSPDDINYKVTAFVFANESSLQPQVRIEEKHFIADFMKFNCSLGDVHYNCVATYDTTGSAYNIAVNMPSKARLACDALEPGAESCSADGKAIVHTYGTAVNPLPNAVIFENGKVDSSWVFKGWFSEALGAGDKVSEISEGVFVDTTIYSFFEKTIQAKYKDKNIDVVIEYGDTQSEIESKIVNGFKGSSPSVVVAENENRGDSAFVLIGWAQDGKGVYEPRYNGSVRKDTVHVEYDIEKMLDVEILVTDSKDLIIQKVEDALEKANLKVVLPATKSDDSLNVFVAWVTDDGHKYYPDVMTVCKEYPIVFDLPKDVELIDGFDHYNYGVKTILPTARVKNDPSWKFAGWILRGDGVNRMVGSIAASDTGSKNLYPLLQKTIEYAIGGDAGSFVVTYGGNDVDEIIESNLENLAPKKIDDANGEHTFVKWNQRTDGVYEAVYTGTLGFVKTLMNPSFDVVVNGRSVVVDGVKSGSLLSVFDIRGRQIFKVRTENKSQCIRLPNAGNYIVKVANQTRRINVR